MMQMLSASRIQNNSSFFQPINDKMMDLFQFNQNRYYRNCLRQGSGIKTSKNSEHALENLVHI